MSILNFSVLRATWICMYFSMWKHVYSSFLFQCSQWFMYISCLGVQWGRTCSKICPLYECEKRTLVARAGKITCCHGTEEKRFGLESINAYYPWINEAAIFLGFVHPPSPWTSWGGLISIFIFMNLSTSAFFKMKINGVVKNVGGKKIMSGLFFSWLQLLTREI